MEDDVIELDVSDLIDVIDVYEMRLKNLPMDLYAQMLLSKVDEMFQTQGASGTEGVWQPLSESTLRRHPRRRGGMVLQDTGAMAAGNMAETREFDIQINNAKAYARWHLGGTDRMVQRDFFAINYAQALDEIGDLVVQELQ